jgi:hypothetical protein
MKMLMSRDVEKQCTLDCETNETARISVANILGIAQADLVAYLRSFTFKKNDGVEVLFSSILEKFGQVWGFSHTAWFHLTRCLPRCSFANGLLPLSDVTDDIWNFLFSICKYPISKRDWDEFRKQIESCRGKKHSDIYRIRTTLHTQNGPDGILIGDINFNRTVGQAHFLDEGPEFVMLICQEFKAEYGYELFNDFKANTKPCMVKFITPDSDVDSLLAALNYIYEIEQPEPIFGITQSTCYLGKGRPVSPEFIQKIVYV